MPGYVPILFDFEKPKARSYTETVTTLARLSRFIVADFTGARSLPQKLEAIASTLRSVPIQPIIHEMEYEWAMCVDFYDLPQVLPPQVYSTIDKLKAKLQKSVIDPAERRANEIRDRRGALEQVSKKRNCSVKRRRSRR